MFQVLSSTVLAPSLMTPPGFKYFTAVKETNVRKTLTLKASSLTERDHVTDTSEVRSHVDLRDTGRRSEPRNAPGELVTNDSYLVQSPV